MKRPNFICLILTLCLGGIVFQAIPVAAAIQVLITNLVRSHRDALLHRLRETFRIRSSPRHDDILFGEVPAKCVDELCPLAHKKVAGTKNHRSGLLFLRLHGDVAQRRA